MTAIKIIGLLIAALVVFIVIIGCSAIVAALLVRTMDEEDRVPDDVINRVRDEQSEVHSRH